MKSTPKITVDRPLIITRSKYISQKVLGFIATDGAKITVPGVPYLYCHPDNYSTISIFPVVFSRVLVRYCKDYS